MPLETSTKINALTRGFKPLDACKALIARQLKILRFVTKAIVLGRGIGRIHRTFRESGFLKKNLRIWTLDPTHLFLKFTALKGNTKLENLSGP